ncbi:MAG: NTP transferase domain-containing protein [Syntrophomonadaceae bacterium]|nr:NTP transferase domain-containing protein [Syntrophomonadaceae bacterium]
MRAVILAGGKGVRLKPYTVTLPKPLVPIGEEPIMQLVLANLANQGIKRVDLCVNHMCDLIKAYFGDGSRLGLDIHYSREEKPLGTVGPLKLLKTLPVHFLVMNGDVLTDLSLRRLYHEHVNDDAIMTIATFRRKTTVEFGVIKFGDDHYVRDFTEKPEYDVSVSMGIYIFNQRVLDYVPENTYFGFDDLMYELLRAGEKIKVVEHHGYWLDIGRPEDYEKANNDMAGLLGQICFKAGSQ